MNAYKKAADSFNYIAVNIMDIKKCIKSWGLDTKWLFNVGSVWVLEKDTLFNNSPIKIKWVFWHQVTVCHSYGQIETNERFTSSFYDDQLDVCRFF